MNFSKKKPSLDLNSESIFNGLIRYKKSKYVQFNVYYGILYANGIFVLLTSNLKSRKVYFKTSMKDISRVEPVLSTVEPYSFMLVPYISTKNVVYLSAFNDIEMKRWISKFTEIRKNLHGLMSDVFFDPFQNDEPQYIDDFDLKQLSNDECYDSVSGIVMSQNMGTTTFVNDLINLDKVESGLCGSTSYEGFEESWKLDSNDLISEGASNNMNSDQYYNSANFVGTKQQSFQILKEKSFNGSYLVRFDSLTNEMFLDVWDDYLTLSFELIYQNDYVKLKGDSKHFDNITYLLYYYSFNKLPNSCSHLEIPFRLIDT